MSQHLPGDEDRTKDLLNALRGSPSWLRHRGLASRLDRLLLLGASMEELNEVRPTAAEHITHLRVVHGLRVEETGGIWRIEA